MTAVFPGSFDPFTTGHEAIVRRGLLLFDKIIIAVGYNDQKQGFLSVDKRVELIGDVFVGQSRVEVARYRGLTTDFCKTKQVKFVLRSVRNTADLEYERTMADINQRLDSTIENILLIAEPQFASVSSTIVRELQRYGADTSQFLPQEIKLENYL